MKRSDLLQYIGQFGILTTINYEFKKELPGWIKEVDMAGNVWFASTEDQYFFFKAGTIKKFEPEEFKEK